MIDYAQIIAKADQRRATLQNLEAQIALAPRILEAAASVLDYLDALSDNWQALDSEGRNLLPREVREAVSRSMGGYQRQINDEVLQPLAAQLKEPQ
jgi:hypothetical protein